MKGKIEINIERCKGCLFCVNACPFKIIKVSQKTNKSGIHYVECDEEKIDKCTGCTLCAVVCPDVAIEVWRIKDEK